MILLYLKILFKPWKSQIRFRKKEIILSKQEVSIDLLAVVSQLLDVPADSVKPDTNLIELGLDSISMMRLTGQLRSAGINLNFAQLMATPTLDAWQKLVVATKATT